MSFLSTESAKSVNDKTVKLLAIGVYMQQMKKLTTTQYQRMHFC